MERILTRTLSGELTSHLKIQTPIAMLHNGLVRKMD
jgi:hypothetical protein